MNSNRWRFVYQMVVLGLIVLAAGCTGSEVLAPSSQNFRVSIELVNYESRFEIAELQVLQTRVRPVDPVASDALGTNSLGMLNLPILASSLEPGGASDLALPNGLYELITLRVNNISLVDLDTPVPGPVCEDWFPVWDLPGVNINIINFGEDVITAVEEGGDNELRITIDGQAFIEVLQASWTCIDVGGVSVPDTYNPSIFAARANEFLEFN
jgi:hypothetical protein